ncbi:MAG: YfhO family protein [Pseudomonadota bacterium]
MTRHFWPIFALVACGWVAMALLAPGGLFVVDEALYLAAAEGFARDGSLIIDNGHAAYESEDLRLQQLFIVGVNGLTPQYPAGYTTLAAPLVAELGINGFFALNTVAAIACVWLTWRLGRLLFQDEALARTAALLLLLAGFLVEYAVSVLPHALSALCVLAATWFAMRATMARQSSTGAATLNAGLAGLVFGAGLLVRVDIVLIALPLSVVVAAFAAQPLRLIAPAAIGAAPGVLAACWINSYKFGVFFPVSYGRASGGDDDPASYLVFAAAALALVAFAFALRRRELRVVVLVGATLLSAGLAVFVMTGPSADEAKTSLGALARGVYDLVFDLRSIDEIRPGIERVEDGVVLFWGLAKKALAQSLPWLGIIAALFVSRVRAENRLGLALSALAVLLWVLPFARSSWHGGYAANMRYFLPVLPFVCLLAAAGLTQVEAAAKERGWRAYALGLALGALLIAGALAMTGASFRPVIGQQVPLLLCAALGAAALISGASPVIARSAKALFSAALLVAFFNAYAVDQRYNLSRRGFFAEVEATLTQLPPESLIYGRVAEPFMFHIRRGEGPLAMAGRFNEVVDLALVEAALADGRPVFIQGEDLSDQPLAANPALRKTQATPAMGWFAPIWRIERGE